MERKNPSGGGFLPIILALLCVTCGLGLGKGDEAGRSRIKRQSGLAGSFVRSQFSASWAVDRDEGTVDFVLRSTDPIAGWLGLGISDNQKMAQSDILLGILEGTTLHMTDRWATSYYLPTPDTNSQILRSSGRRIDGVLEIAFTIPCQSTDTKDVSINGDHYFLFAAGVGVGTTPSYHSRARRWFTEEPVTINCLPVPTTAPPVAETPTMAASVQPSAGSFVRPQFSASWTVNREDRTVDFVLRSTDPIAGWLGLGISDNQKMANSDILLGILEGTTLHMTDRWATSYYLPTPDTDSQILRSSGRRIDGVLEIAFTIPCQSADTKDISINGDHYFLFAAGLDVGTTPSYHSRARRWFTEEPVTINCLPVPTTAPTVAETTSMMATSRPPPTGTFVRPQFSASWTVNSDDSTVDFVLSSTDPSMGWLAVGISDDQKMVNSDLLIGLLDGTTLHTTDGWSFSYGLPATDADSQILRSSGRRSDGVLEISFSIPCQSADTNDISVNGDHYFLFAAGQAYGTAPSYHSSARRWFTDELVTINCLREVTTATPTTMPERVLRVENITDSTVTVVLSHPVPSGSSRQVVVTTPASDVVSSATLNAGDSSATLRSLVPNAVYRVRIIDGVANPSVSFRTEAFSGTPTGSASYDRLQAKWAVDVDEQTVTFALTSPTTGSWLGLGISHDQSMPNSDIITGSVDGTGAPLVEDRYAFSNSPPSLDSSSQVRNPRASVLDGTTTISFALPCNSADPEDISLEGSRYLLFAQGPITPSGISYHVWRAATSAVFISCQPPTSYPTPAPGPAVEITSTTDSSTVIKISNMDSDLPSSGPVHIGVLVTAQDGYDILRTNITDASANILVDHLQANTVYTVTVTEGLSSVPVVHTGFRTKAFAGEPDGTFVNSVISAEWKVFPSRQGVYFSLSADAGGNWLGLGISEDAFMAHSDIVTGYIDNNGGVAVQDRYSRGKTRPLKDPTQNIANQRGSVLDGSTAISFLLPCNSSDVVSDVPLVASPHFFLFARGRQRNGFLGYHSSNQRFVSDSRYSIVCDTVKVPLSIALGAVDPLADSYGVELYRYNWATGLRDLVYSRAGLSARDFPHDVEGGVESGVYYQSGARSINTAGSRHSNFGYHKLGSVGDLPVFMEWPRELGLSVSDSGIGESQVSISLPRLSSSFRTRFSTFDVEYRRMYESEWVPVPGVATSQLSLDLPENLTAGSYEIRVRGNGQVPSEYTPAMQFYTVGRQPLSVPLASEDPLASTYSVRVLVYDTSSGEYNAAYSEDGLMAADFPHAVPGGVASSSHYAIVVDGVLEDGRRSSVSLLSHKSEPVGARRPPLVPLPSGITTRPTAINESSVTVHLLQMPIELMARFPVYIVSYRRFGDTDFLSLLAYPSTAMSSLSFVFPETLPDGRYQLVVVGASADLQTVTPATPLLNFYTAGLGKSSA